MGGHAQRHAEDFGAGERFAAAGGARSGASDALSRRSNTGAQRHHRLAGAPAGGYDELFSLNEVKIEVMRSRGAGGQVNSSNLLYLVSGLTVLSMSIKQSPLFA